ncbi:MAG: spermidine synthase, partial [Pseudomonadota bacterium]
MKNTSTTPEAGALFLDQPQLNGALGLAIAIDRVLFQQRSKFQDIQVVEAGGLGRMLILDGIIQAAEFDEKSYHEMLVHVPMLSHPCPENVLVIGGGDGGSLREIAKHRSVRKIDIRELDEAVIQACRQYLPSLAQGFDDPRVNIHLADGALFASGRQAEYDVILVDCPDPVGPAKAL